MTHTEKTPHPFGRWPSPISPESMTSGQVSLDEVRTDGRDTLWLEGRPDNAGRVALVRADADGTRTDVLAGEWNLRSRVHEYGGGAYAVSDGVVVFSHFGDHRLHRLDTRVPDAAPVPITPQAPPGAVRFGGLVCSGAWVFAVREDHRGDGEPVNTLVRLALAGPNEDFGTVLHDGSDFVSRPAVSPDGATIAVVAWDHPNMPWDCTRLLVGTLTETGASGLRVVAGGSYAVAQPEFSPNGELWFASERGGWLRLHRLRDGREQTFETGDHDVMGPQWTLGMVDYGFLTDGRVALRILGEFGSELAVLDPDSGELTGLESGGVTLDQLTVAGAEVAFRRGLLDRPAEIVRGPITGDLRVLATAGAADVDAAYISVAEPRTWRNSADQLVHGLFHPPRSAAVRGPDGAAPPLIVMLHGGPTSRTEASLVPGVQFWTTRGFAVLWVNYGGSTGFGRDYRDRLAGQWGVVDVDDAVTGARDLARRGMVDEALCFIRGGSAGGYTVLRALTTSTVFAGGVSYFGISDLDLLAAETHKFESRYDTTLLGGEPGGQIYRERSPIHAVAALHGSLLLLQGSDDHAVPLRQATGFHDALLAAGKDVELVVYDEEGHGFRGAHAVADAYRRENAFYERIIRARQG